MLRQPLILPLLALAACTTEPASEDCTGRHCGGGGDADTDTDTDTSGIRVPAEWEPQAAVWMQWPRSYERADEPDFGRMVAALLRFEDVHILVHDARTRDSAEASLADDGGLASSVIGGGASREGFKITWHDIPNDNAWMRDNGPLYVVRDGEVRIQDWGFDAWGGAFGRDVTYRSDDVVPDAVGEYLDMPVDKVDLVHERGNFEFNGVDTAVLNWTVLGDEKRNPGLTRADAEATLKAKLGVSRVVMVEGAPSDDLTGGHIDGIARFIDADRIVVADCSAASACQPGDADDQIFDAAADTLEAAGLTVIRWPFASKVRYEGVDMSTDYMNWLVVNGGVLVNGYEDAAADAAAKAKLEGWFPGREVVVIPMLQSWFDGGGAHCHTNDQPAGG